MLCLSYIRESNTGRVLNNITDALKQGKNVLDNPACNAAQYDKLKQYYKYSEKYREDGVKELSNGKYRFYGKISPAKTPGEMMERRYARE